MSITRTIAIDDLTADELASTFLNWDGERQAAFFNAFKAHTDQWSGAGWCQQSCEISRFLNRDGIETILKLGAWAAEPFTDQAQREASDPDEPFGRQSDLRPGFFEDDMP